MASKPDVPHAVVAEIAAQVRELQVLHARQAATQAELIRGCIAAIQQTTDQASRRLQAQLIRDQRAGRRPMTAQVRMHEPTAKVRDDKARAFVHLEWLATQLENASVRLPDNTSSIEGD